MWQDNSKIVPKADGYYMVQTVYGDVSTMIYTVKGGWNTSYVNGELDTSYATSDGYIARWLDAPLPPMVTEEMFRAYRERNRA